MIDEKCKNCKELIIPYLSPHGIPNQRLSKEDIRGTCRCNVDAWNRLDYGFCGWCHPSECRGAGHKYYFDWSTPNRDIKFID